ncbi:MAG TPA: hypothetical protein VHV30_15130 [Polyangiaceae bacterium]|jgi:hypothetical protein|nr:hypothetical protein [Polyangiaceae bacterium]
MARRSRPPRQRKSRTPEAPHREVAVLVPADPAPAEDTLREPLAVTAPSEPHDELAALDAGWD